jgi:flavodoxin
MDAQLRERERSDSMHTASLKSLVVVHSYHQGNTLMIAKAMAEVLDARVKTPLETDPGELADYDLVGFGSGIDSGNHYGPILDFADRSPQAEGRKAFIFSTCGIPVFAFGERYIEKYKAESHAALRVKLVSKGYEIVGEFNCAGLNSNSFLKLFGGVNKGRPTAEDLEDARAFALRASGEKRA